MEISEELNDSLRAKYNPDGSELRKYQLRLLDTLVEFDRICREHGIKYWISCGTLLGARRHGGFIPWDDDIDVDITYSEYKKLLAVFQENDKIAIQTPETDLYCPHHSPKIRDKHSYIHEVRGLDCFKYNGCFIDLFVLEDTFELPARILYWIIIIQSKLLRAQRPYGVIRKSAYKLMKKGSLFFQYTIRAVCKYIPGKHFGYGYGSPFYRNRLCKEDYSTTGTIEFEGHIFPCPGQIEQFLEHMYGDWRKMPDLSKLHPHIDECQIFDYNQSK